MKECQSCKRCFSDDLIHCPNDGQKLMVSLRGTTLLEGRYQLERRLGDGGMGIVYKGHHSYLKTIHAIKVILPDLVGHDPMFGTRFRQEAMIAASIRHPNIVLVTDFGIAQDILPFLVMEFIKGKSLHNLFVQKGNLPPEMALQIMTAIGAGVGAAHKQGIIHRDLKPLNIMIKDDLPIMEAVKILDFGLAKIRSSEMFGSFVQAKTTGLMGSPLYMAPEQWGDGELDNRADIYSLGVILYQMLAGDVPFKGSAMPTIMHGHLMLEPPRFSDLGVPVPPPIEEVVRFALEKNPDKRPPTVEELIDHLREASVRIELSRRAGFVSQEQTLSMAPTDDETSTANLEVTRRADSAPEYPSESRTSIQEEAERLAREFDEAQRRAEDARIRAEAAAQRRAEEEAERKLAEEEAARKRAKEAELRQREEEEADRRRALEAARKLIEEEETRKAAAEEARRTAEEEAERIRVKEAAERMAREIDVLQVQAGEARKQAEEEARKRSEEVQARKLAEEKAERLSREVEAAQKRAEEARLRAAEEAEKRAVEDSLRKQIEEEKAHKRADNEAQRFAELEAARLLLKEEADRLGREVEEAQRRAEAARLRTEEEAGKRIEEEAARKRAEEEAKRLAKEVEEARKRVEEERERQAQAEVEALRAVDEASRKHIEEELERRAEEVAQKWAKEEAARRQAEEEAARKRAEEHAQRLAEQEAARRRAEDEAKRLAIEIEEAELRAEQALLRAEQEARERAEENELRRAEDETTRQRTKEDADRLAREVQDAQLRAEEARIQAEEEIRKRSEEETARRLAEDKAEALKLEVEKAQRRAEEARQRVEEEARQQAQREEQRRKEDKAARQAEAAERKKLLDEIKLLEAEKLQREEAMRVAEREALAVMAVRQDAMYGSGGQFVLDQVGAPAVSGGGQISYRPGSQPGSQPVTVEPSIQTGKNLQTSNTVATFSNTAADSIPRKPGFLRFVPFIAVFGVLAILSGGYVVYKATRQTAVVDKPTSPGQITVDNFIRIPAGTFLMGRNDVPADSNQRPAHPITLPGFYVQKTEVTNAEYAEFVQKENYRSPWQVDNKPPAGQEQWPVSNVSQEDALAYARWLSKRDGVTYRLPTEEQWEYAARSGTNNIYPWGNEWFEDRANLGSGAGREKDTAKPVGSYPAGASAWGVLDMIGNVWEWTASEASFYPGISASLDSDDRGQIIMRGGSHQSMSENTIKKRGGREFSAAFRQWLPKNTRDATIGFRLVRVAQ